MTEKDRADMAELRLERMEKLLEHMILTWQHRVDDCCGAMVGHDFCENYGCGNIQGIINKLQLLKNI